jgi:hypothetical protein
LPGDEPTTDADIRKKQKSFMKDLFKPSKLKKGQKDTVEAAFYKAILFMIGQINPDYYKRYRPMNSQSISQIMHKVSIGENVLPGVMLLNVMNSNRVIKNQKKENEDSRQKSLRVGDFATKYVFFG